MKTIRALAFAGSFFLLTPVAQAGQEDPPPQQYCSIMFGAFVPEDTALKDGYALILLAGGMVNPYFGVQGELGGFSASANGDEVTMMEGIGISLKVALPIALIEPYLLAGAGLAMNSFSQLEGFQGFPVHAAFGVNIINYLTLDLGVEARQVWHEAHGLNVDGLMLMAKIHYRF